MRISFPVSLLMACSFLLPAYGPEGGRLFRVEYGRRLKVSSQSELEQRFHAVFAEGMAHPAGVSNCAQLLRLGDRSRETTGRASEFEAERSTTVECLVLQQLLSAKPAHSSYVHDLQWDKHVLPLLPPQLAVTVSDEAKRAAKEAALKGESWPDFDRSVSANQKGPDGIVVSGNGFREQLILWGRGDFMGDGTEDLLVQSRDTLTEGTYRNVRLFVLSRRTAKGRLSVVKALFWNG